jgi:hypothetical protein
MPGVIFSSAFFNLYEIIPFPAPKSQESPAEKKRGTPDGDKKPLRRMGLECWFLLQVLTLRYSQTPGRQFDCSKRLYNITDLPGFVKPCFGKTPGQALLVYLNSWNDKGLS